MDLTAEGIVWDKAAPVQFKLTIYWGKTVNNKHIHERISVNPIADNCMGVL